MQNSQDAKTAAFKAFSLQAWLVVQGETFQKKADVDYLLPGVIRWLVPRGGGKIGVLRARFGVPGHIQFCPFRRTIYRAKDEERETDASVRCFFGRLDSLACVVDAAWPSPRTTPTTTRTARLTGMELSGPGQALRFPQKG